MVAVIECPDVQLLKLGIRALDDFPCLSIPFNARDSHYPVKCSETAGPYQVCLYVNTVCFSIILNFGFLDSWMATNGC